MFINYVNRYFTVYNFIQSIVVKNKTPLKILVQGGNFGLGCNSLYYLDLLSFFPNAKVYFGENNGKNLKTDANIIDVKNDIKITVGE